MSQLDLSLHENKSFIVTPPRRSFKTPTLLNKATAAYLVWNGYHQSLPKIHKYSLGQRVDTVFIEAVEIIAVALYATEFEKLPVVEQAIKKADILKILLMIIWEAKSLDNNKYLVLSEKVNEIGRMLGGWRGSLLAKQNSPEKKTGEK